MNTKTESEAAVRKTALQRLIDGPDEDCQRGAVEQHFCQDRGKCACMDEIVSGVARRIAELEAAIRSSRALADHGVHGECGPVEACEEIHKLLSAALRQGD
jgi:hypothetical protein